MRLLFLGAALTLLAACGEPPAGRADACALSAQTPFSFSNSAIDDVATARAFGPTCDQAVVLLTLRNANGDILWTHAGTFHDMVHGSPRAPGAEPATEAEVQNFLAAWANVTIQQSGALPSWREDAERPGGDDQPFTYATPLDRDAYERLRALDAPQICFAAGAETSRCIIMDPATRAPILLAEFGP